MSVPSTSRRARSAAFCALAAGGLGAVGVGPIDDVGFLAGCWAMSARDRTVEEQWMAPSGGILVGMGRTVRDGQARGYEHLLIREDGDDLVYRAAPAGQPITEFRSELREPGRVRFANPEHDFPQTIEYHRSAQGDSLLARVAGTIDGREAVSEFGYERVRCPAE